MKTRLLALALALTGGGLLAGCATDEASGYNPDDPFEGYNRAVYGINDTADKVAFKPIARGYQEYTPEPVQDCAGNAFDNLKEPVRSVSLLVILEPVKAYRSAERFVVNTAAGVFGCIDIAGGALNNERTEIDLGIAYRYWTLDEPEPQPFVMLPLLGPTTPVDATGSYFASAYLDPMSWSRKKDERVSRNARNGQSWMRRNPYDISDPTKRQYIYVWQAIDQRANLLDATDFIDENALDRYAFTRDAWREQRAGQARDLREDY